MSSREMAPASSQRTSRPAIRKTGAEKTFRWMSDAPRATPSRRIVSSSTYSFLSAPLRATRFRGPRSLRTALGRFVSRREAKLLTHPRFDGGGHVGVLEQVVARVLAPLADALPVERVPGARLLDDTLFAAKVDQLAGLGDALSIEDVELDLPERRRHLV